jgi:hypothetical protein
MAQRSNAQFSFDKALSKLEGAQRLQPRGAT